MWFHMLICHAIPFPSRTKGFLLHNGRSCFVSFPSYDHLRVNHIGENINLIFFPLSFFLFDVIYLLQLLQINSFFLSLFFDI